MPIHSPRLRRLDRILLDLETDEAMLLGELDGYVAGILVCPELILPGEWLPAVWGGPANPMPFDDERDVQWFLDKIMQHYNAVATALAKGAGRFDPFFEVDVRHDETLWELWIEGFGRAINLRPDSGAQIQAGGDQAATEAFAGLMMLAEIADDSSDLERAVIDDITDRAHDMIPGWVETLHAWRMANQKLPDTFPATVSSAASPKAGRNDPCPCGSGRKYKKCCGLN